VTATRLPRSNGWPTVRAVLGALLTTMLGATVLLATVLQPHEACAAGRPGNYTVGEYAYRKLEKIHELLAAEQLSGAGELLDQLAGRSKLNPHETALLYQARGYLSSALGDYAAAALWFDKCLAQDALPESAMLNTRYNLAQLHLATENFGKALAALEQWFEQTDRPAGSAWYLLAAVYVQLERHADALEPARHAVQLSKTPARSWLELLVSLELEQQRYGAAAPLLEELVQRFARKRYFLQLSAVYGELGRHDDALAIEQVAWEAGLLDRAPELRRLARRYLYHDLPWRAARVVDNAITDKVLDPGLDDWQLLADSYLLARESERALVPLEKAAALEPAGPPALQLARLYIAGERWRDAERVLRGCLAALDSEPGHTRDGERDNDDTPARSRQWSTASLLLGISLASDERLGEALKVFEQIEREGGDSTALDDARRWTAHISAEKNAQLLNKP